MQYPMCKVITLPEGGRNVRILIAFLCLKCCSFTKTGIFTSRWGLTPAWEKHVTEVIAFLVCNIWCMIQIPATFRFQSQLCGTLVERKEGHCGISPYISSLIKNSWINCCTVEQLVSLEAKSENKTMSCSGLYYVEFLLPFLS